MKLSKHEQRRYSRQIILKNISKKGQRKLKEATVTVIGIGALGSTISNNLARSGIGKLRLIDRDVVELENLHRQILFSEGDLDQPKALIAAEYLKKVNPDIEIEGYVKDVNFSTIGLLLKEKEAHIILDGTDNLETRFLINDYSHSTGIPWVYGGVVGTQGMSMNIIPNKNSKAPCFRCMVPEMPAAGSLPTCDTYGILNTVPVILGSIQSTEAIKILLGSKNLNNGLIFYDVWSHEFRTLEIPRNKKCKCCVKHDYEFLNIKKRTIVTTLCGQDSVQIVPIKVGKLDLDMLEKTLARVGDAKRTKYTLEFSVEKYKITAFPDGRALIKGTSDDKIAKSLYTKYIGM